MAHQDYVALGDDKIARGIPHHARAKPWIAEGFEQSLSFHPVIELLVQSQ